MKMKNIRTIAMVLFMLFAISACDNPVPKNQNNETVPIAIESASSPLLSDIVDKIIEEIEFPTPVKKELSDVSDYYYDINPSELEEASFVLCGSGAYPDEIVIFKFDTKGNAEKAENMLQNRLEEKIALFETYAPDEMYKLNTAFISIKSEYAIFCAVSDNEKAQSIINSFY